MCLSMLKVLLVECVTGLSKIYSKIYSVKELLSLLIYLEILRWCNLHAVFSFHCHLEVCEADGHS